MGTSCGPQFADIQVVHLSGPRSQYVDNFSAIVREVEPRLGQAGGPRNVVILGDTLNGGGYDYGLGENVLGTAGDRRGSSNVHNYGGFASVLFSRDGQNAPGAGARNWWPEGFLHEMSHNLGAVQWSAPHSTQPPGFTLPRYGHCWQGADVMCYMEDSGAAHAMQYDCPRVGGAIPQAYDCGRDDYFNPAPPAGSYLADHWNVYDSAFLAPCAQIAPACGGGTDGLAPTPPVSTAAPGAVRRAAPRRLGRRAARRLAQRPADLQLPLAAPEAQDLAQHLTAPPARPTSRPATTAAAGCACRSLPPTRTAARRPRPRPARAWPTAWSAARSASPATSAVLRPELDGLLPGAAVIELQSGLRRDAEHGDVVHPARLTPGGRVAERRRGVRRRPPQTGRGELAERGGVGAAEVERV